MRVNGVDHVNIVTDDLAATARFYAEVLGLEPRHGPPPSRPDQVCWIYDARGRPILHVVARSARLSSPSAAGFDPAAAEHKTGVIDHVSLSCDGLTEMIERLERLGLPFRLSPIPRLNLTQVFIHDPNGLLLELNFVEPPAA